MQNTNQTQTLRRMRGGKYEWNEGENVKYRMESRARRGRIVYVRVMRRLYPLRGYGNYEELNVELTLLRKNVRVEVYYLRDSWNGSGYFPVCKEEIPRDVFDDIVIHGNIKNVFEALGNYFKDTGKCPSGAWVLFPPPS